MAAPKVLLVGMDGAQYEKMQALSLPNINRLQITRSYTGGINGAASQQATVSGPGWATILTGVWTSKHTVTSNDSGLADARYPSLFKRIRDARPNAYIASVTHWGSINNQFFTNDVAGNNFNASNLADQAVADKVVELVNTTPADFVFAHLDDVDEAGHASGFGSAYDSALRAADARLGQMLNAVQARQAANGDDWLVLVTTDHGRDPLLGYNHGNQTQSEKTTFIASSKAMNAEFSQRIVNVSNQDFSGLYGYAAQTWIAPTVLRHLGIEPRADWKLDGAPLTGAVAVRKLLPAQGGQYSFNWFADAVGMIDISRNGEPLASVPALQQGFLDSAAPKGVVDYTLSVNGTPVSLRLNRNEIQSTLDWDTTRSYFFLTDGSYVRYNNVLDRAESGYPQAVTEGNWPGLTPYASKLVGGFSKDASTAYLFLADGTYLRYDKTNDKVEAGYPKPINDSTWPGLGSYATQIVATLRWTGDKVQFFLRDGRYIRYSLTADHADAGYPKAVNNSSWPGVGNYATKIRAAVKWNDTKAYFFLNDGSYIRYNISSDKADAGYPKTVNSSTWPGVLSY
ncbi:alkaline phosphatase family protein [Andreprevotia sp. IGB-42]|uniref:alkaline phosphatase family protein n=1 Tax=Andreprevotia sp. IGB-42 TaxID=2497473 RepID=UPI00191E640B|nr:alkaline phosphatase family protein [Andreprevotia sp. IGB-42]